MAKKFDISLTLAATDKMTHVINTAVNNGIAKFQKLGKQADAIARSSANFAQNVGTVGLAAGAALALPVKTAMDFEQAMARTGAITRAMPEDMDKLTASARLMGKTTQYTAMQAAEAQMLLGMAGFKTTDILEALPHTLNLAAAGAIDLATAADISSNILSGFGKDASELGFVNDVLVNTFTRSNVTLQTLGETMKYVAPIAKGLKIPIEQVAAMAGVLGNAGLKGSMAGTALASSMQNLASTTSPGAKALKELGVNVADASGNMLPLMDIFEALNKATNGMGNLQKTDIVSRIFGKEAAAEITALLDKTKGGELAKFAKELTEGGSASATAARQMATAQGAMLLFESASQDLFITLGNALLPTITKLINKASAVANAFAGFAERNPILAKTLLMVTAGFSAIMLTASGLGFIISGIATTFSALVSLGPILAAGLGMVGSALSYITAVLIANPIGATIAAIALAALLIYKYWEPLKSYFVGLWENIKGAFDKGFIQGVWEVIVSLFKTFNPMALLARGINALVDYFFGINLFDAGASILDGLWQGMKSKFEFITSGAMSLGDSISAGFKAALGIASPSRVFMEHGVNIAKGAEIGMNKGGLATSAGTTAGRAIAPNLGASAGGNIGGAVNVTYAPVVNIAGGTEADKTNFMEMLRNHKREILEVIAEAKGRETRLSY
jgi:TP901 family phage tail tape measure protein